MTGTTIRGRKHATRLLRALGQDALLAAELANAHSRLLILAERLLVVRSDSLAVNCPSRYEMEVCVAHFEDVAEARRRLAIKLGALSARLADELHAAGWTDTQARHAELRELASGVSPAATDRHPHEVQRQVGSRSSVLEGAANAARDGRPPAEHDSIHDETLTRGPKKGGMQCH